MCPKVIEADPVRLSQILSNLVNNALKFTEAGHVRVSVELAARDPAGSRRAALLRRRHRDRHFGRQGGPHLRGIQPGRSFDHPAFRGTGLGLSICQRLVGAMDGRIWAESEIGKGSVFRFTIHARALQEAEPVAVNAGRAALLAVEGAATRAALAAELHRAGYQIAETTPMVPYPKLTWSLRARTSSRRMAGP
jgi:hypothetical protein